MQSQNKNLQLHTFFKFGFTKLVGPTPRSPLTLSDWLQTGIKILQLICNFLQPSSYNLQPIILAPIDVLVMGAAPLHFVPHDCCLCFTYVNMQFYIQYSYYILLIINIKIYLPIIYLQSLYVNMANLRTVFLLINKKIRKLIGSLVGDITFFLYLYTSY